MAIDVNKTMGSTIRDNTNQRFDWLRDETARILKDGKVTGDEVQALEQLKGKVTALFVEDLKVLEEKIARQNKADRIVEDPALRNDGARKGSGDLWAHADQGDLSLLRGAEYQLTLAFDTTIHALKTLSAGQNPPVDEVNKLMSLAALLAKGTPKDEDLEAFYRSLVAKSGANDAERNRLFDVKGAVGSIGRANGEDMRAKEVQVWGPKDKPNVEWRDKTYKPK